MNGINSPAFFRAKNRLLELLKQTKLQWFECRDGGITVVSNFNDIGWAKSELTKVKEIETIFNSEQTYFVLDDIASTYTRGKNKVLYYHFKIRSADI